MSSVNIIIIIVILLFIMVCGMFISQRITLKREQRHRLINVLQAKKNKFKAIITICPNGFLSRELKVLALRNVIESCEKLSEIEPDESSHLNDVQTYSSELNITQRQAPQGLPTPIDNAALFPQLQACLDELFQFIVNMESKQVLPQKQADSLKAQIKILALKLSTDKSEMQGQVAIDNGQQKLALHYFTLALQMILKDAKGSILEKKVPELKERIKHIKMRLIQQAQSNANRANNTDKTSQTEPSSATDDTSCDTVNSEWAKFEDNSWKKKNMYD